MMRICYDDEGNMPFSYFNTKGQLVGLDIELLEILGEDFDTRIEFVPIPGGQDLSLYFNSGYCDMGIGNGLAPQLSMVQDYSIPYLDYTLAFLVKDFRRHEFNNLKLLRQEDLILAIGSDPYYQHLLHDLLPRANLLAIDSYDTFFDHYSDKADGLVTLAEKGAAWSLLYPEYTVATPFGDKIKFPVAFPVPLGEESLADLLKNWITLKQKDGTINDLYDYWILGMQPTHHTPRWSIVRDVLHWVD
jgi:ABC-type amino acid transport substrate-binding protein